MSRSTIGATRGVGFLLVEMRIRKLLESLVATPMRRTLFLGAVMANRMSADGRFKRGFVNGAEYRRPTGAGEVVFEVMRPTCGE